MNKAASRIVIVSAKRTPFGAFGGKLKSMTATDLTVHSTQVIASCPQPSAVATTLSRRLSIHPSIRAKPCALLTAASRLPERHFGPGAPRVRQRTPRMSAPRKTRTSFAPAAAQMANLSGRQRHTDHWPQPPPCEPHCSSLAALQAALAAANVSPELIDTVCVGNVQQTSSDAAYLGRHVALRSGMATRTPALNVNRLCGSGFQ